MNTITQPLCGAIAQPELPVNSSIYGPDLTFHDGLTWEQGREAPLDLIKRHLTDDIYTKASRGYPELSDLKNWHIPVEGHDYTRESHFVLKVQPFSLGGYEVTITELDLEGIGRMMDRERNQGEREQGEQNENNIISSQQRSKKNVRLKIKEMGCDRLLTLTRRENKETEFWTVDDWSKAWDNFRRLCKKYGHEFQYVAVLERHKSGALHLHAAIDRHIPVNIIRGLWYSCVGGKGQGNIDISFKPNMTVHQRRAGCAKYVSKYITKQSGHVEFNKKRYWSSKCKLMPARRYILKADKIESALDEVFGFLGLNMLAAVDKVFVFPGKDGAWFSYDEFMSKPVPF